MKIKDPKIAMASAAMKALDYIKSKKVYEPEEVLKFVMKDLDANPSAKVSAIAAANEAIKIRRENPQMTDKQIMQSIMNSMNEIMHRFD
jgi:hypothetical protein